MYGKIVNKDYTVKDRKYVLKIGETYTYGGHFSKLNKTYENYMLHFTHKPLEELRLLEITPLDEKEIYDIDGTALHSRNFRIERELKFEDYLSFKQIQNINSQVFYNGLQDG